MMKVEKQLERLKPLTSKEVEQYNENGFVLIKNGCSHDLIDAFNSHIHSIRSASEMPNWAAVKDENRFKVRVFNPHLHDGFALQMMKLPVVSGALAQLMGDKAVGVQSMYFYKEPGAKGQAAHQDYFYIRNHPNTMVAGYIAMEDIDEENGCLWVIPGSHKLGLLKHVEVKNKNEHEPGTDETEGVDLSKEIPVRMKKGDILFFHNLLIHSSTKNRSENRWRKSYVCHYIRHDSEIEREDLKKKISLS